MKLPDYIDDIANLVTIGFAVKGISAWLKRQTHGFFIITILYMLCIYTWMFLLITGRFSMDGMEKHEVILIYIVSVAMTVRFNTIMRRWFSD